MRGDGAGFIAALLRAIGVPGSAAAQVIRTADADLHGLGAGDSPRLIPLADNVHAHEPLMGESGTGPAFTTSTPIAVTPAGVRVADAQGSVGKTRRLVETIARLTPQPIRHIVICADPMDHVAGNGALPAGVAFIAHPTSRDVIDQAARRLAQSGVSPIPVPQETVTDRRTLVLGGTVIDTRVIGRAHTEGDLVVHLPQQGVLLLSEIFFNRLYPSVGGSKSARPGEWVETLKRAAAIDAAVACPDTVSSTVRPCCARNWSTSAARSRTWWPKGDGCTMRR